jgi:hypothetical protein
MFRIILCGGQTGVDQAAHRAAQESNILCAGWCPPNRECESGTIPARFPLQLAPQEKSVFAPPEVRRSLRTEWNARDSDGTLVILPGGADPKAITDPGTKWTKTAADRYGRPVCFCTVCAESKVDDEVARVADWARGHGIRVLNVAGPSEGTAPGVGDWTYPFLIKLFKGPATANALYRSAHPVALWLVPQQSHAREIQDLILRQAVKHGTPGFYPHVTFLSGTLEGDRDPALKQLRDAVDSFCGQHVRLKLHLGEIGKGNEFLRFLFRKVDKEEPLQAARKTFRMNHAFPRFIIPDHQAAPHLSLMYNKPGDTQDNIKKELNTEWSRRKLPAEVSFEEIWIVMPSGGDWEDVGSWEVKHIGKLRSK